MDPLLAVAFFLLGDEADVSFPSFFRFFPPDEELFLDVVSDALSDGSAFAAFFPRTGSILVKNPAIFSMWFLAVDACFDLLQDKASFGRR